MGSFLTTCGGFTPLVDSLVEVRGRTFATVWGVLWRYSQMEDGVCKASVESIAARAGVSEKTVRRALSDMVETGYIMDLTPDRRNRPHVYKLTPKARLVGSLRAVDEDAGVGHGDQPVGHGDQPKPDEVGHGDQPRLDMVTNEDTDIRDMKAKEREEDLSLSWPSVLDQLELTMTRTTLSLFSNCKLLKIDGDYLVVAPSEYVAGTIRERLMGKLAEAMERAGISGSGSISVGSAR